MIDRLELEALLDRLEDRERVVLNVIDERPFGEGRDDQSRNAVAFPPDAVVGWMRNVIPESAVLVIGQNDQRVGPLGAVLNRVDDARHVLLSREQIGVAGVLVIPAYRFDETHRREIA